MIFKFFARLKKIAFTLKVKDRTWWIMEHIMS